MASAVAAYSGLISGGTRPPSVSKNQCDGHTRCSSTYQPTRANANVPRDVSRPQRSQREVRNVRDAPRPASDLLVGARHRAQRGRAFGGVGIHGQVDGARAHALSQVQPDLEEHVRVFGHDVDVPELDAPRRPPAQRVRRLRHQSVAGRQARQRVQREHAADGAQEGWQSAVIGVEQDGRLVDVQHPVRMRQRVMPQRRQVLAVEARVGVEHGHQQVLGVELPSVDERRPRRAGRPRRGWTICPSLRPADPGERVTSQWPNTPSKRRVRLAARARASGSRSSNASTTASRSRGHGLVGQAIERLGQ